MAQLSTLILPKIVQFLDSLTSRKFGFGQMRRLELKKPGLQKR
jgi:hypothetical protein